MAFGLHAGQIIEFEALGRTWHGVVPSVRAWREITALTARSEAAMTGGLDAEIAATEDSLRLVLHADDLPAVADLSLDDRWGLFVATKLVVRFGVPEKKVCGSPATSGGETGAAMAAPTAP